ncbi:MAG TPA: tetratricopeptide repeat protein [Xanthomonadaceae bacterium]|nr:tetratricopeptide repeat protein [Xanthomonadaceae bacterium]
MRSALVPMVLAAAWLAACAQPEPEPRSGGPDGQAAPRDVLAEVRAAGEGPDALDVQPLRAAEVVDLREQALRAERAGDLQAAAAALEQALAIAPEDPELVQLSAEVLLARGDLDEAEQRAYRAWELGPRVGSLCRRHWAAIRIARELRGNPQAAERAREQSATCVHQPPVRM